jgi:predicted nucleic acid-binding protein
LADVAAVNASPLIYLTEAGRLELLRLAGEEVVVPEAVAQQVRRWGHDDPAARALATTPWLREVADAVVHPSIQVWDLGPGETAVLSWALVHHGLAILDDMAARRCAAAHHLPVRGTLGLVLAAKRKGLIPAARPVLDELRQAGMYLADSLLNRALSLVGE